MDVVKIGAVKAIPIYGRKLNFVLSAQIFQFRSNSTPEMPTEFSKLL
jgi:hypothetical protein